MQFGKIVWDSNETAIEVWAILPGINLEANLLQEGAGRYIVITGNKELPMTEGKYEQKILVTANVDLNMDMAEAAYSNGILHITIPKTQPTRTTIKIAGLDKTV